MENENTNWGQSVIGTGMSSMDFNIDVEKIIDIPKAIGSLETDRIDYKWLLDYGFRVIGIHPNAYGNNSHVILFAKELEDDNLDKRII